MGTIIFDKLEKEGFQGVLETLVESFYDTGLIWKEKKNSFEFLYESDTCKGIALFEKGVNLARLYKDLDWDTLFSYLGIYEEYFFEMPIPIQIYQLCDFYGIENILRFDEG